MKWSELRHTTRCAVVDIVCVVLCILLLTFCSCVEKAQDGVVTRILQGSDGNSSEYNGQQL